MLLKFIGENEDTEPVGPDCPFVVGEIYEVAEIFEHPWHMMARNPGETRWPKPGDSMFSWPPEFFERTDKPIPIVACGYALVDAYGEFGVLLDDPKDVARARAYDEMIDVILPQHEDDSPQENESYDDWYKRVGHDYPASVAQCVYKLANLPIGVPYVRVPDNVFLTDDGLREPFVTVSYYTCNMVWCDVSRSEAEQHITSFLRALSIKPRPARLLNNFNWWAYLEYPRLINPPD